MAHLLVVDDDLSFREAMHFALTKRGHQVTTALNVDHARNLMVSQSFDLLIVDVMMQGETGLEFLKSLRQDGQRVPVIIYSAYSDVSLEKAARLAGADEVIQKDTLTAVLYGHIERLLGRKTSS